MTPHGTILWKFFESEVGTVGCSEERSSRKTSSETKKCYREVRREKHLLQNRKISKNHLGNSWYLTNQQKKKACNQSDIPFGETSIHLIGRHLKRMFYGTSLKPETHLPDIPSFAHTLAGSRPWIGHGFSGWNADRFGVCRWSYERK